MLHKKGVSSRLVPRFFPGTFLAHVVVCQKSDFLVSHPETQVSSHSRSSCLISNRISSSNKSGTQQCLILLDKSLTGDRIFSSHVSKRYFVYTSSRLRSQPNFPSHASRNTTSSQSRLFLSHQAIHVSCVLCCRCVLQESRRHAVGVIVATRVFCRVIDCAPLYLLRHNRS